MIENVPTKIRRKNLTVITPTSHRCNWCYSEQIESTPSAESLSLKILTIWRTVGSFEVNGEAGYSH